MDDLVGNVATIETAAAIVIAICLDIIPGVKPRWKKLNPAQKQLGMVVIMFLLALAATGAQCYRGVCPADWGEWILVTGESFIVFFGAANVAHYGTRYMTAGKGPNGAGDARQ